MHKLILAAALATFSNSQARAETCPDFFRFVDFGLEAPDGTINRGGPTFRAESFDGRALLLRERTVCRVVRDTAVDGRGNPIPVVTSVTYHPEAAGVDLLELRLTLVEDLVSETERNAAEHRAKLDRPDAHLTRGPNYLCASLEGSDKVSCQLISPFGGNLPLVIYCDAVACDMPLLAIKAKVVAVATWQPSQVASVDYEPLAKEIVEKVQQVHDFLAPLTS